MAITIINDFLNKFHKRKAIEKIQMTLMKEKLKDTTLAVLNKQSICSGMIVNLL